MKKFVATTVAAAFLFTGVPAVIHPAKAEASEWGKIIGDVLLILEAMKMQNEIAATQAGTVKAINVAAGQSVKAGDSLVIVG